MFDIEKLGKNLKGRWDRAQHHRNRIDRQKRMIDPSSIVLFPEFHAQAVKPAYESHGAFKDVFADGRGIANVVQSWAYTGYAPVFSVPLDVVEGKIKDEYLAGLRMRIEMGNQMMSMVKSIFSGQDNVFFVSGGLSGDVEKDLEVASKQTTIPGVYVYHLALAMELHRTAVGGTGIKRYERKALWRDQGQHVVEFWERVNNLRDYSGHFPNKKPPKGNRPDDDSGRSKVGGFEPAFT